MLRNCFRALRTGDDENGERLWGAALGSGGQSRLWRYSCAQVLEISIAIGAAGQRFIIGNFLAAVLSRAVTKYLSRCLALFPNLCVLCVLCANPFPPIPPSISHQQSKFINHQSPPNPPPSLHPAPCRYWLPACAEPIRRARIDAPPLRLNFSTAPTFPSTTQ